MCHWNYFSNKLETQNNGYITTILSGKSTDIGLARPGNTSTWILHKLPAAGQSEDPAKTAD